MLLTIYVTLHKNVKLKSEAGRRCTSSSSQTDLVLLSGSQLGQKTGDEAESVPWLPQSQSQSQSQSLALSLLAVTISVALVERFCLVTSPNIAWG